MLKVKLCIARCGLWTDKTSRNGHERGRESPTNPNDYKNGALHIRRVMHSRESNHDAVGEAHSPLSTQRALEPAIQAVGGGV